MLGQRHFDVQIMGGAALHFGWVAEMKTGEGKTLVATLPSLPERARRAAACTSSRSTTTSPASTPSGWAGCTASSAWRSARSSPTTRRPTQKRRQYDCDITYGTNNEFGFDYLRDNMVVRREQQVQRGHRDELVKPHFFAIVDEVDSILIDEARTPLIISGRADDAAELYYQFARIVQGLQRDRDYEVDEAKRTVVPTEEGIAPGRGGARRREPLRARATRTSCTSSSRRCEAKELFKRDVDYIVADGEVKIVDEFTGRILEGRRWSEGLHQAVEAKEGVKIKEENQTLATVTLQNYFRMYDKLAGMTGTAYTEAGEFAHTYDLEVVSIPTNRPMVRDDDADLIYKSEDGKFDAAVDDIAERHADGPAGARRHDLGREVREARRACSRSAASRTRC